MQIKFLGTDYTTSVNNSGFSRFMPEPATKLTAVFQSILKTGLDVASKVAGATSLIGIEPEYAELIQQQMHVQDQMQRVSLISNIEKSRHESEMSVVRNIRVG